MPTIARIEGFRVLVYPNDHIPPHVHVRKAGWEARIFIGAVAVLWDVTSGNPTTKEIRRAVEVVAQNLAACNAKWEEIHG